MKCEKCSEAGTKSRVRPGAVYRTDLEPDCYYDREGLYHYHDRNFTTCKYKCSNGHQWKATLWLGCDACKTYTETTIKWLTETTG